MKKSLQRLRDSQTFIGHYLRSMSDSETPESFDLWCALWVMSSLIGRHVYVARPRAPVFLNWYVILVADSGTARKSSAIRAATELVRSLISDNVDMIEGKTTPEKLEATLARQTALHSKAEAVISISELVTFMGRDRYSMAMPGLLTDLYDSPEQRRSPGSLSGGSTTLLQVYVTLIGASTPNWLAQSINPNVVAGGFTSRCIFVYASEPKRKIAWPDGRGINLSECRQYLTRLRERWTGLGGITLSATALQTFTKWYNKRVPSDDEYRSTFESREDAHVLRLAACLCINDNTFEIQTEHVQLATEIINDAKNSGKEIFTLKTNDNSRLEIGIEHLRSVLITAGMDGISGKDLSIRMARFLNGAELRLTLRTMFELALVQQFELPRDGPGRPKTIWRATKAIMAKDAFNSVKERIEQ